MKRGQRDKALNILFVCRYNRFRSRVAKSYFDKINKNRRIKTKSAGLIKGEPVNKTASKAAKEFRLNINGPTKGLSSELLKWADKIIVIADDVPKNVFDDNKGSLRKTKVLKIKDTKVINPDAFKKIIKGIMKEMDKLNKNLNKR